jgi:hypothetical protein
LINSESNLDAILIYSDSTGELIIWDSRTER